MSTQDWRTYLVFCIDQLGRSVFSPQDPLRNKFYLRNAADFSLDEQSRSNFETHTRKVFETGLPSPTFCWSARYDENTVRHYTADIMPVTGDIAIVLLYRDGLKGVDLTETEKSILQLLAHDQSNADIATELSVAESTVRTHVSNLKTKLKVGGRVRLGIEAYRLGLVKIDDWKNS